MSGYHQRSTGKLHGETPVEIPTYRHIIPAYEIRGPLCDTSGGPLRRILNPSRGYSPFRINGLQRPATALLPCREGFEASFDGVISRPPMRAYSGQ